MPEWLVGGDERALPELVADLGFDSRVEAQLGALWGKSAEKGGGCVNLLLGHLLDTAAVAECMWESYLAPWIRWRLDEVTNGHGKQFFMWICGIHDCGKATPAFQSIDAAGAASVRAAGLTWQATALKSRRWKHDKAGGTLLNEVLGAEWGREHTRWVWPLVAGHHGTFPDSDVFRCPQARGEHQGRRSKDWQTVQRAVLDVFTRALGYPDLKSVRPSDCLTKAEQLALSGLIVMADWIASNETNFSGLDSLGKVSLAACRERAAKGWQALGLRGGWGQIAAPPAEVDLVKLRFGDSARQSQAQLVELAREMPVPGLLVVEAPMGEGKTKAALAAAEILAARFGFDGIFLAMPTQATCEPMYDAVLDWVPHFGDGLEEQVALLHGKHRFNKRWKEIWEPQAGDPDDDYGSIEEDDDFYDGPTAESAERHGPAQWFLGRKRGLLTGFGVGTIDQLLYAATRTRHVMLRFAGLVGKVVVIDEVHAADVYMRQFLEEALKWLGQAGVPVVLLSATLPPSHRQALVDAYLSGGLGQADVHEPVLEPAGYPCVTAAWASEGKSVVHSPRESTASWRESLPVSLSWLPDVSADGEAVADAVCQELAGGGVALAILNSVDRAQGVFTRLRDTFDGEVHLLHGRLCAAHRAERTEEVLNKLGKDPDVARPTRMVVVATQLAEQSFDADADLLITDLAPVDLLLQRMGRLHRHEGTERPPALRHPRVLVTGVVPGDGSEIPQMLGASEAIYGRYLLLRTAAEVGRVAGELHADGQNSRAGTWSVPAEVPGLVATVYGDTDICPATWTAAETAARKSWESKEAHRSDEAQKFLLTARRDWARPTLAGLHYAGSAGAGTENELDALVRDGKRSVEVVLVRSVPGGYTALDGTRIGFHGEAMDDPVVEAVLAGTTRLPPKLTAAAESELAPLPGWSAHPWLKYTPALVFDETGSAELGAFQVRYDDALGLVVRGGGRR